ncbi:primase-helicase family protein [Magnetospirillum fulvum]|uniref:NrS-1 polymerase-like helicase domain-containing protein n=1 Tax=Magnetospirillum fulvum MGU-K5 TaxID=1316936 RepID=S9S8D1_MAGFU|nr:primase-helicase family protein [Magnetospirillum fulvum]EPY00934.1 hypothetical protein K678_13658 [Magnetospirillum fulvum MGU-K5]
MTEPIDLAKAKQQRKGGRGGSGVRRPGDPLEERLREISKEFALVLLGGKALILRETVNYRRRPVVEFLSIEAFKAWLDDEQAFDEDARRMVGIGGLWLKSKERRKYAGVEFAPEGMPDEICGNRWFNLWRGYSVSPAPFYPNPADHLKHIPTFADHIARNVAGEKEDIGRWVWGWFADLVQNPESKVGTALVLRGRQGSGKSKPGEVVGSLLGDHYVKVAKSSHLTGQFNSHMFNCLLLQADEGFWAGDKEAEGVLKDLVTGDVHMLERKGVDGVQVRNLIRLYVTSNNTWVVPAGFEERRFAVLDVADGNLQDHSFFARIDEEMDAGGREHLLAYLLRFDLSQVNLRKIPDTEGLWEQKVASMSDFDHWWLGKLRDGRLLPWHDGWESDVPTGPLYDDFRLFVDRIHRGRKMPKEQWAIAVRGKVPRRFRDDQKVRVPLIEKDVWVVDSSGEKVWTRARGWKDFPTLRECRDHFSSMVGRKFDWGDGEGDSPPPAPPPVADDGGCWDLT